MAGGSLDIAAFRASLPGSAPPSGISGPLTALWHAAKTDWDRAHKIVMGDQSREAAWVHAYLHRVEGDLDNAGYWYRRAGKTTASVPLPAEWEEIATALLLHAS